MTTRNSGKAKPPIKLTVDAPDTSPMSKFHKAMQKIITVPKTKLKDK